MIYKDIFLKENFYILKIISVLTAAFFIFICNIHFFSVVGGDGFMSSVFIFRDNVWADIDYELKYVHIIRYIICLPFVYRLKFGLPYFLDSLIFSFIISCFVKKRLSCILYFLPLFVSFRTGLCICSIYGIWSTLNSCEKSLTSTTLSFFLSILSSGVLFNWALIFILRNITGLQKKIDFKIVFFFIFLTLGIIIISTSIAHKIYFFTSTLHDNQSFLSLLDGIINILKRSNLVDPFIRGSYMKFYIYNFYFIFSFFCVYISRRIYPRWKTSFLFLITLANCLVEGLPFVSYIFVYIEIIMNGYNFKNKTIQDFLQR